MSTTVMVLLAFGLGFTLASLASRIHLFHFVRTKFAKKKAAEKQ